MQCPSPSFWSLFQGNRQVDSFVAGLFAGTGKLAQSTKLAFGQIGWRQIRSFAAVSSPGSNTMQIADSDSDSWRSGKDSPLSGDRCAPIKVNDKRDNLKVWETKWRIASMESSCGQWWIESSASLDRINQSLSAFLLLTFTVIGSFCNSVSASVAYRF